MSFVLLISFFCLDPVLAEGCDKPEIKIAQKGEHNENND